MLPKFLVQTNEYISQIIQKAPILVQEKSELMAPITAKIKACDGDM